MLHHEHFRQPAPGEPRVLAVFSYRYDAHLVPDLLENLRPGVHGYVAWDDRSATSALTSEPDRRARLFQAARDLGADWFLTPDPDERLERGFADGLPDLLAQGTDKVWDFRFHELFAPGLVRTDGPWGAKSKVILFPAAAAKVDPAVLLHAPQIGDGAGFRRRRSGLILYHLRMAWAPRRQLRRDLYAAADPERRFQRIGYDYLSDDRGMVLEPIAPGRDFHPPFVEDHGLWSPDPGDVGPVVPDPYPVRLARAAGSARRCGPLDAHHVLADLARESPQDHDLPLLAGHLAAEAGAVDLARAMADRVLGQRHDDPGARLLRLVASVGTVAPDAGDLAALATTTRSDSPLLAALRAEVTRHGTRLDATDAAWRAHAPPDMGIQEGRDIPRSDLATIVIGFQSQTGLSAAVRSLLDQDSPTEIVVVNSGGGCVRSDLAPVADRIRLLTCETPLFVGAARQIGVAASRAPCIAFLAGDCRARPGWVAGRLARHRAGADAVASAVVSPEGAGLVARAAGLLHYAARHPDAPPQHLSLYGLSYSRRLLWHSGAFPPGLRTGEDTWLNRAARRIARPVWAPEVVTEHADPQTLAGWLSDDRQRGRRRAGHHPFRPAALVADPAVTIAPILAARRDIARRLVSRLPGLSGVERQAVLAMHWLALRADLRGTLEGLADIAEAEAHVLAARACQPERQAEALALVSESRQRDSCDAAKARLDGELRSQAGDIAGAITAFRAALALAPDDTPSARALVGLVAARDGSGAALTLAEELALAAPGRAALWALAADQALAAGLPSWAVVLNRIALLRTIDRPDAHRRQATLHLAAGDPVAAAFRGLTARRLAETPPPTA